jgi:hypothetical protein
MRHRQKKTEYGDADGAEWDESVFDFSAGEIAGGEAT